MRIRSLVVLALTSSAIALQGTVPAHAATRLVSFGAYVQPGPGVCTSISHIDAVHAFELSGCLAGKLSSDRIYYKWDPATFAASTKEATDCQERRRPHISFRPLLPGVNPKPVPWATIADGSQDAVIDAFATKLIEITSDQHPRCRPWVTFNHEADNDAIGGYSGYDLGTPAEFAAAWRHLYDRLATDGVNRIRRVLVLDSWAYKGAVPASFDPGAGYVDLYATDAFNRPFCVGGTWQALSVIDGPALAYATAHGKPLLLSEWASEADPNDAARRSAWITDAGTWIKANPVIAAVQYWNGSDGACDYQLNQDASSMAVMTSMANDSYFGDR
jgi:hypothetical protein